ncbi:VOC family protein [Actinacidiphila alni]|uniref:VOC family protein n=1 Tax=Actinacidiphila alni TaxID=380248 RepID=UPI0033E3E7DA
MDAIGEQFGFHALHGVIQSVRSADRNAEPGFGAADEFWAEGRSASAYVIGVRIRRHIMTTPAHAGRMLFVNMPVADVERSRGFFGGLGFGFDPRFSDGSAACMPVGEQAFVMLLGREKFAEFAKLPVADARTHTLALYCFSVGSRAEVDTVVEAALGAGGTEADGPEDHGFMYARSFYDLDGHGWQVMWMDPSAMPTEDAAS